MSNKDEMLISYTQDKIKTISLSLVLSWLISGNYQHIYKLNSDFDNTNYPHDNQYIHFAVQNIGQDPLSDKSVCRSI